jgi:hypothetical protein
MLDKLKGKKTIKSWCYGQCAGKYSKEKSPMEATLQNIFRSGFGAYKKHHGLSIDQYKAAQAIMDCQSDALGYEKWECLEDGHTRGRL